MKAPAAQKTPLILTPRDEEILKALHTYRYMTAKDVAYHLLKPQSAPYCRRLLMRLAGGDFQTRTYRGHLDLWYPVPPTKGGHHHGHITVH
jgi:hypothetical protein